MLKIMMTVVFAGAWYAVSKYCIETATTAGSSNNQIIGATAVWGLSTLVFAALLSALIESK